MSIKTYILNLFLGLFLSFYANAQKTPLVYNSENTAGKCSKSEVQKFSSLPVIELLPDPFLMSNGKRKTKFKDWECRRAEIISQIEHYEIGKKPEKPKQIKAEFYPDSTLHVFITVNMQTLELTSKMTLPKGKGPFPLLIGIGRGTGSLPQNILEDKPIATLAFNFSQVMSHTQKRGEEPINKLYPDQMDMGAYSAWSWGVSRIIDGLELISGKVPIDLKHIGITGCSFAGKMALFAGALDERIALTIAQESGGGGAAAWRVSETLGNVETLGKTSHAWFKEDLFKFSDQVSKLPFDHHELMALIAPRALLVLGNTDYEWLADESGYVSCRAAHEVWKTFGIPDRFGFSIVGGHRHCQLPESQRPEVNAFIDKFLLDNKEANTVVEKHPFPDVDYNKWFAWWGRKNEPK